jgi:hypothetical protein
VWRCSGCRGHYLPGLSAFRLRGTSSLERADNSEGLMTLRIWLKVDWHVSLSIVCCTILAFLRDACLVEVSMSSKNLERSCSLVVNLSDVDCFCAFLNCRFAAVGLLLIMSIGRVSMSCGSEKFGSFFCIFVCHR